MPNLEFKYYVNSITYIKIKSILIDLKRTYDKLISSNIMLLN